MKAIFIDVEHEQVYLLNIKEGIEAIYNAIGCTTFTVATVLENEDAIYVDDEGILTLSSESKFFFFEGAYQPFIGNGLIVGTDDEGGSVDAKSSVTSIKKKVTFLTLNQARKYFNN